MRKCRSSAVVTRGTGVSSAVVVGGLISYAVGRRNGMLHRVVFSYVPKRIVAVGRCGGMLYRCSSYFSVGIALCFVHHCDGTRPR